MYYPCDKNYGMEGVLSKKHVKIVKKMFVKNYSCVSRNVCEIKEKIIMYIENTNHVLSDHGFRQKPLRFELWGAREDLPPTDPRRNASL